MKTHEINGVYTRIEKSTSIKGNLKTNSDIRIDGTMDGNCLLYTSPSPRDATLSRMPSSA